MRVDHGLDAPGVVRGFARAPPLADASFDVVVSSRAIHNLPDVDDRERACAEIAGVARTGRSFRMYPPVRVVTARRPED